MEASGSAIRVRTHFNDFKAEDYAAFERLLAEGLAVYSVKLYCFQLMPNHGHSILPVGAAPRRNRFHMDIATSALNRATLSIATNLAEMSVLLTKAGCQNFFSIASGTVNDRKEIRPLGFFRILDFVFRDMEAESVAQNWASLLQ